MATRWRMPPERSFGKRMRNSLTCRQLASSSSTLRPDVLPSIVPWISMPNSMFWATVIHGNSAYSWKTMPRSGPGAVTGLPLTETVPPVGSRESRDRVEQGRLAAAGRPEQADELAGEMSRSMFLSAAPRVRIAVESSACRDVLYGNLCGHCSIVWLPRWLSLDAAVPAQEMIVQPVHADVDREAENANGEHARDDLVAHKNSRASRMR